MARRRTKRRVARRARGLLARVGIGGPIQRAIFFRRSPVGRVLRPFAKMLGV